MFTVRELLSIVRNGTYICIMTHDSVKNKDDFIFVGDVYNYFYLSLVASGEIVKSIELEKNKLKIWI
jgi:hypothetical protein